MVGQVTPAALWLMVCGAALFCVDVMHHGLLVAHEGLLLSCLLVLVLGTCTMFRCGWWAFTCCLQAVAQSQVPHCALKEHRREKAREDLQAYMQELQKTDPQAYADLQQSEVGADGT
jgi:type VI protein secretion system component VasK